MFERLTERARRALFFARAETSQLGWTSIDTEHLLLGLIREGKGLTGRLFADAGIGFDLETVEFFVENEVDHACHSVRAITSLLSSNEGQPAVRRLSPGHLWFLARA